jgi:hypothetical protein
MGVHLFCSSSLGRRGLYNHGISILKSEVGQSKTSEGFFLQTHLDLEHTDKSKAFN